MNSIKNLWPSHNYGFYQSAEVSAGIIRTEGDVNILFTHSGL